MIAPLFGLVLAGGRSRRMGTEKAALAYQGAPQLEVAHELLSAVCERVFVSCRRDQPLPPGPWRLLHDGGESLGPASGILAAHAAAPGAAWLVLACDLPFVGLGLLQRLVESRATQRQATAFRHADETLEPLCAIWEPQGLEVLARATAGGDLSPRRTLEGVDCLRLDPDRPDALCSVNTPEEYARARGGEPR